VKLFAFFAIIFVLAASAFLYSRTLPHLKDETAKLKLEDDYYSALQRADRLPVHFDAAFDRAYDNLLANYLTPRNVIKKYSLSILVLAAGGMMLFCCGIKGLQTPPSKWLILPAGLIATALTSFGMLQDSNEEFGRGEHPIWYDNGPGFAIGFFVIMFVLLVWIALHTTFLIGRQYNLQTTIIGRHLKYANRLLAAELMLTFLMVVWALWEGGSYFSLTATPFWLYFYASILAIRAKASEQLKSATASA
jgi:hypothetical protein